jgi:ABC-2 type transport system permease protein
MGFAVFLGTEWLVLALLHTRQARAEIEASMGGLGLDTDVFFSGLTLAAVIIMVSFQLLAQLFLALVGGDIVAKDVEDGTLRMTLCRPVGRFEVLAVKWAAVMVYAAALVAFIGLTSLLSGLAIRGAGDLFVMSPVNGRVAFFPASEGLARYGLALLVMLGPAAAVASLAFMFSCFPFKPSTATVLTLAVICADYILGEIPYLKPFRPHLLHVQLTSWIRVFHDVVPWWTVGGALCYLAAFSGSAFLIGATVFSTRDLK